MCGKQVFDAVLSPFRNVDLLRFGAAAVETDQAVGDGKHLPCINVAIRAHFNEMPGSDVTVQLFGRKAFFYVVVSTVKADESESADFKVVNILLYLEVLVYTARIICYYIHHVVLPLNEMNLLALSF